MLEDLPVFGVCGYSGSGKTTLLETVVSRLVQRGFQVAVVKHDVHGIERDKPDKDSDRLFCVGADVAVHGPGETLTRFHHSDDCPLETTINRLVPRCDLVLLEGFKNWRGRKAWLLQPGEPAPPAHIGPCEPILPRESDRAAILEATLTRFVVEQSDRTPVYGCVLVGGASRRMGQAKHLLTRADGTGETWLHRTIQILQPCCQQVVLAGCAEIPEDLRHLPRLPDSPGVNGPLAGLLSAMRWAPRVGWLLTACDMPRLNTEAVRWLLARRSPGVWAVVPRHPWSGRVEPLLAWYDFRSRLLIESIAATNQSPGLGQVARHPKIHSVPIPAALAHAWNDADTPEAAAPFVGNVLRNVETPT